MFTRPPLDADEVVAICGVQVEGGHVARSCLRGSTVREGTARKQPGQLSPASRWVEGGSRHRLVDRDAERAQTVGDVVPAAERAVVALVPFDVDEAHRGGSSFGEQWASYVRVTFLQPEEVLSEAMTRLKRVVARLRA